MTIFVLHHGRTRVTVGTGDDQIPHFVEVRRRDWLGEGQLAREDWRNADFIWFDVHIGRDNRASRVVDTLSLGKEERRSEIIRLNRLSRYHHVLAEETLFLF